MIIKNAVKNDNHGNTARCYDSDAILDSLEIIFNMIFIDNEKEKKNRSGSR